ncbi:O-antigen ligase family protein [Streptomyces sp. TLI_185]|uniref:O-antigen ligase family protein n=1 Tax=Streptomyces sp. TLI_185 TaxID=2485151 RepID=UPI000F98E745|nr:O-antigen ligase family protein [Streptomyces sp. TLI_185]RPF38094.1 O-antigen ligase [Streptomyces sp. TLI_185]
MTITELDPRPAPDLSPRRRRIPRADWLARWTAAAAIAGLPVQLPRGPGNTSPADVIILVAMAASVLWAGSTRQLLKFPYLLPVSTMITAGSIAAVAGAFPYAGTVALFQDVFLLAWAITLANVGRTKAAAAFLLRAWCVSGSLWALGLLAFTIHNASTSGLATAEAVRASFTIGEQNGAGFYLVVTFFMILAGRWPRKLRYRIPVLACLLLDALLTGSLGAFTGLLAGLGLAIVVRTAARRGAAAALVALLVLTVVGGVGYRQAQHYHVVERAQTSQQVLLRNSIGRAQQSASERALLTQETLQLWRSSSPLGQGPASTKNALYRDMAPYPKEAHDDWMAALVERGVLGCAGLLMLTGEVVARGFRVGSARRLGPGFSAAIPAPHYLVGALAALAVNTFTHEMLHDRTTWALLGLLAAFSLWNRQAQAKRLESPAPPPKPVPTAPDRRTR